MNNTNNTVNNVFTLSTGIPGTHRRSLSVPRVRKWGGLFFLFAMALQGIPLGGEVPDTTLYFAEDKYAALVPIVTTLGIERGWLPAVVWGLLYSGALLFLFTCYFRTTRRLLVQQWPLLFLLLLTPLSIFWSIYPERVVMNTIHTFGTLFLAVAAALL